MEGIVVGFCAASRGYYFRKGPLSIKFLITKIMNDAIQCAFLEQDEADTCLRARTLDFMMAA
ncbi:hypothetical protein TcasGA2_TC009737 [Tribolium castaneum]|uniref:Uncharacterized protein n=1 Tax=Tribolium castaneum TaxID=7070 RepID=D6WP92_TRICA|nr:hypothetical protein TcasGA2_TC009737 [Tribolium castaneum]